MKRYPGAAPFGDDEISRAVFFGRVAESSHLADQIMAHRLVVVYAKSGLGKTSLLRAGVSQRMRDESYCPLFVRVNDINSGPIESLFTGVANEAARQKVEYVEGSGSSLWHFFKSAEFWEGDRLLTPVLILDQFEELFTLHTPESREAFLRALGHLIRGARPAQSDAPRLENELPLSDTPPNLRIVLSLREDYLGSLEEAATSIPQILDHRFRLAPLSPSAAVSAMQGPAQIVYAKLSTEPFEFESSTTSAIVTYLTRRADKSVVSPANSVEPFHLQLICQRAESIVAKRQQQGVRDVEINLNDLGGERGLGRTLSDFYGTVISTISPRSRRKRVRRLCEQYLISPEGHRLSLDQREIRRILKLNFATLNELVSLRLLRADQRADSWYYELSHDSLVVPILGTRKTRGVAMGFVTLMSSAIVGFIGVVLVIGILLALYYFLSTDFEVVARELILDTETTRREFVLGAVTIGSTLACIGGLLVWLGGFGFRRSVEVLNRFMSPPT